MLALVQLKKSQCLTMFHSFFHDGFFLSGKILLIGHQTYCVLDLVLLTMTISPSSFYSVVCSSKWSGCTKYMLEKTTFLFTSVGWHVSNCQGGIRACSHVCRQFSSLHNKSSFYSSALRFVKASEFLFIASVSCLEWLVDFVTSIEENLFCKNSAGCL